MRLRLASLLLLVATLAAQTAPPLAVAVPPPDPRFKTDILVIVAHPDDETPIGGYLARAIFDQHKRVAVLYGTQGGAGGNNNGEEQGAALAAEREIEVRSALASWGVNNVWFLGGVDTPGQDVLRSLETWHHGTALDAAVRLVRLTRPDVILTWLPDVVIGENHGDHQAAGVIACEAFDLAGDATAFPEQITPPRNRRAVSNLTEGLHPWQPQKLYFFSDARHPEFLDGKGPSYPTTDISPSRHVTYAQLMADEQAFHLTQDDVGAPALQALKSGDFHLNQVPIRSGLGKSLVATSPTADIFANLAPQPLAFVPAPGYRPRVRSGLSLALGGPWNFYRHFWQAHGLNTLPGLLAPQISIAGGQALQIPLLIRNDTNAAQDVTLTADLPDQWQMRSGAALYHVPPHSTVPVEAAVLSPKQFAPELQDITWTAATPGLPPVSVKLEVELRDGGLPQ